MTRINALPTANIFDLNDSIPVDGSNGTRRLVGAEAFGRLADTFATNAQFHKNIFRGKKLGTSFTADQKNAISNGTFENLYIGDYWQNAGTEWILADMDYWFGIGQTPQTLVNKHHIVIIPRTVLGNAQMNTTATNSGGYLAANIRSRFSSIVAQVKNFFGQTNLLTVRRPFSSASNGGRATDRQWIDATCELMSERMVYGSPVFEIQNIEPANGANPNQHFAWNHTADLSQLALFRLAPEFKVAGAAGYNVDSGYWLNTMAKWDHFCICVGGAADCLPANESHGIRPVMAITG